MVQLLAEDITTKEVLSWKGLHLFHAEFSSSSQKLRVLMNLKGANRESHPVDLLANEHLTSYFMGINPRAVVPVLIDNGDVHIESNDIMLYLERRFPEPRLIPAGMEHQIASMLHEENALHFDLRTLTFRFMFDPSKSPKSEDDLRRYTTGETGTVRGKRDGAITREAVFWRDYMENGVSDEAARRSAQAFRRAFDAVDHELANHEYVLGKEMSLADIAWLTDAQRLAYAGYPHKTLHPHLDAWRDRLMGRPEIARELRLPPGLDEAVMVWQRLLQAQRQTLTDVCFPELRAGA